MQNKMTKIKFTLSKGINGILEKLDPLSTRLAVSALVMTGQDNIASRLMRIFP
jgi:hypothetical protein